MKARIGLVAGAIATMAVVGAIAVPALAVTNPGGGGSTCVFKQSGPPGIVSLTKRFTIRHCVTPTAARAWIREMTLLWFTRVVTGPIVREPKIGGTSRIEWGVGQMLQWGYQTRDQFGNWHTHIQGNCQQWCG